ncbi:MAG: hypothetical protein WC005_07600 [Candidatus Nanopelagicales bacterium]
MAEIVTFEWDRETYPDLPVWMHEKNCQGWFVSGMPMVSERGTLTFAFIKEDVAMLRKAPTESA